MRGARGERERDGEREVCYLSCPSIIKAKREREEREREMGRGRCATSPVPQSLRQRERERRSSKLVQEVMSCVPQSDQSIHGTQKYVLSKDCTSYMPRTSHLIMLEQFAQVEGKVIIIIIIIITLAHGVAAAAQCSCPWAEMCQPTRAFRRPSCCITSPMNT
jgi:hypothetical protein